VPVLPPGDVLATECDVLAPCALGGVLTRATAASLRCAVVCGAANNQLSDEDAAIALAERGIVYAPDYVVNAGGIINIAEEWAPGGYDRERAYAAAARIGDTTRVVLARARAESITPSRAADELAQQRIRAEGAAPYRPGAPSVMRDALLARRARFA
jgi:glutamate dehydrogenase/leucine dehydrogenase